MNCVILTIFFVIVAIYMLPGSVETRSRAPFFIVGLELTANVSAFCIALSRDFQNGASIFRSALVVLRIALFSIFHIDIRRDQCK